MILVEILWRSLLEKYRLYRLLQTRFCTQLGLVGGLDPLDPLGLVGGWTLWTLWA